MPTATSVTSTTSRTSGDSCPSATFGSLTFAEAYAEHWRAAMLLAYRILGDDDAAEDAVQEAMVKLWTGHAHFDASRGTLRGLLLVMTRHASIDAIRRRNRRRHTETVYCAQATYVADGPESVLEHADGADRLRAALRTLPPAQRSPIEMAYFGGMTRTAIAASAEVSVGTVKSRMRLGLAKLAQSLADQRA